MKKAKEKRKKRTNFNYIVAKLYLACKMLSMGKEENDLKIQAVNLLNSCGFFAWPQNNIRVPGRKFIGKKGVPDVIAVQKNGPSWWVEAKGSLSVQSEDQKKFQKEIEARGHVYILMRTIDDLVEAINNQRSVNYEK